MSKEILTFEDIEIEKNKFYHHKTPIFKKDVDIGKVLVSNKIFSAEKNCKYFIGYLYNDHKVKSLQIMLPRTRTYLKICDGQTKWMHFLIEDDELLAKYNTIWNKSVVIYKMHLIMSLSIIKNF